MLHRSKVASAVLAAGLCLAACSSNSGSGTVIDSSMSAATIAKAAGSALASQSVLKLEGEIPTSGFQGPLKMEMNRTGEFTLSLTHSATGTAPSVEVVKSNNTLYLKMSVAYLESQVPALEKLSPAVRSAVVSALTEKWLIVPTSGPLASLKRIVSVAKSLDLFYLAAEITNIPSGAVVSPEVMHHGIQVVPVSAQGTTIDVATATALPVELFQVGTTNNFSMSYPTSSKIPAPTGAITVRAALGQELYQTILAAGF